MAFTAGEASMAVKSRLVITATGKAATRRKGFLLPNRVRVLSDLKPTMGPQMASQTEPTAEMVPAMAGFTPATVVRYRSRYVPERVYSALSHMPPIPYDNFVENLSFIMKSPLYCLYFKVYSNSTVKSFFHFFGKKATRRPP